MASLLYGVGLWSEIGTVRIHIKIAIYSGKAEGIGEAGPIGGKVETGRPGHKPGLPDNPFTNQYPGSLLSRRESQRFLCDAADSPAG